jgi:outer membrane protein OmpA-like peptidoglycan-associated protein
MNKMDKNKKSFDLFWASYADLMISLFFVMLVLFVSTVIKLNKDKKVLEEQLKVIKTVEENLKPLKKESSLFKYEEKYKRFILAFDVQFNNNQDNINNPSHIVNYSSTIVKTKDAGLKLKQLVDLLMALKKRDSSLNDVSYILTISGYASNYGEVYPNYELSYRRALNLFMYWKSQGIDFEQRQYNELIDLQIAGNGVGGVGRYNNENEVKNQRFIIQIFPKIGNMTNYNKNE